MTGETIFALSSGIGRAGIAVLRISGPDCREAMKRLLAGEKSLEPRRATLVALTHPEGGELLDRCLLLWFPGPDSFTGEDSFELHVHGGRAVVEATLSALAACPGLRPAEAGEFTRRAFDAGRLDLTEVEGLADLITAETEAQRRQALRQLEGGLTARIEAWRLRLIQLLAELEAWIDFPEEALPDDLTAGHAAAVKALSAEMAAALDQGLSARRLREGFMVAILGPPNAGKSSILNRLARRDAAIVSERAGTTRDVVEVHLDLFGFPVTLADTAGLREAVEGDLDPVEREGMRRSRDRAAEADLRLGVFDIQDWPELDRETLALLDGEALVLLNKCDRVPAAPPADSFEGRQVVVVSASEGTGFDRLETLLAERVRAGLDQALAAPGFSRLRHEEILRSCLECLRAFDPGAETELQAEELRFALAQLGRLTGRVDVEDLLDVIFRDFCIGK